MAKATHVPITPEVLDWAIRESGYTEAEVAEKAGAERHNLRSWLRGQSKPTLTETRDLARALKRTPSTFLLPRPPAAPQVLPQFRHAPGSYRTMMSPEERRFLRGARRVQDAAKWLVHELREERPALKRFSVQNDDVERVGDYARRKFIRLLPIPLKDIKTDAQAFQAWRTALQSAGILVLVFPLGEDSARGFSLWDRDAPLIAVTSAWNSAARIYTLFHELGHLLTRTSSVCMDKSVKLSRPTDVAERWCEEFASAALLPWRAVESFLRERFKWSPGDKVDSLRVPGAMAKAFKVSVSAATIRLILRRVSDWSLYSAIRPYVTDRKRSVGGGDGRDRGEIRRDQYGDKVVDLFIRGLKRDVVSRGDLLDYLDVPDAAIDRYQGITAD